MFFKRWPTAVHRPASVPDAQALHSDWKQTLRGMSN